MKECVFSFLIYILDFFKMRRKLSQLYSMVVCVNSNLRDLICFGFEIFALIDPSLLISISNYFKELEG